MSKISNKDRVKAIFDSKSSSYDDHYTKKKDKYSTEKQSRLECTLNVLIASSRAQEQISVLDYGCGIGILSSAIESSDDFKNKNVKYTGYDISEGMICEAKKKTSLIDKKFTTSEAELEPGSYNFVISLGVIGYQNSHANFLINLAQFLKRHSSKLIITHGNRESILRRLLDVINRKIRRIETHYEATDRSEMESVCRRHSLVLENEVYMLPVLSFLPVMITSPNSVLKHFYLTRFIVLGSTTSRND